MTRFKQTCIAITIELTKAITLANTILIDIQKIRKTTKMIMSYYNILVILLRQSDVGVHDTLRNNSFVEIISNTIREA